MTRNGSNISFKRHYATDKAWWAGKRYSSKRIFEIDGTSADAKHNKINNSIQG